MLSEEAAAAPGVAPALREKGCVTRETAELKGFDSPVAFFRIGAKAT